MEAPQTIEEYNAQIARIRSDANKRRAEAWAMVPETVLGIPLNPITPAIYSLLLGTENAYFTNRVPKEGDLRNFVWFCSPRFNPDNPTGGGFYRRLQMWRLNRALELKRPGHTRPQTIVANFYRACLNVHEIIENTFKDGISSGDGQAEPLAASLEAQILDRFAREYQMWPLPKTMRNTPIKQLYQLARCVDRRQFGQDAKYYDRDEIACTESFLEAINSRN